MDTNSNYKQGSSRNVLQDEFPYNSIDNINKNKLEDDYKPFMFSKVNSDDSEKIEDYVTPNMEWLPELIKMDDEFVPDKYFNENNVNVLKSRRSGRSIKPSRRAKE